MKEVVKVVTATTCADVDEVNHKNTHAIRNILFRQSVYQFTSVTT